MKITHFNYRPKENFHALEALIAYMPMIVIINICNKSNMESPKSYEDLCFLKDKTGTYYLGRYFSEKKSEPIINLTGYTPPQEGWEKY